MLSVVPHVVRSVLISNGAFTLTLTAVLMFSMITSISSAAVGVPASPAKRRSPSYRNSTEGIGAPVVTLTVFDVIVAEASV